MKGLKRVINSIISAEMQNLENKDYAENLDDYCIVERNTGFFWGKMPKKRLDYLKSKAEKIST